VSNSPEKTQDCSQMGSRWMWILRALALLSLAELAWLGIRNVQNLVVGLPLIVCYVMVLVGLWKRPLRGALLLAGIAGCLGILATVVPMVIREVSGVAKNDRATIAFAGFIVLTQLGVIVSAWKPRHAISLGNGGARRYIWGGALGVLLCLAVGASAVLFSRATTPQRELGRATLTALQQSLARDEIGAVAASLKSYDELFHNGFPASLQVLAARPSSGLGDCNHFGEETTPDWLAKVIGTGRTDSYAFTYEPGPPVENAPAGCVPGVKSYKLSARPLEYQKTGVSSFFTSSDDPPSIHETKEDRAATAQDPIWTPYRHGGD
jgi:hypothetical protein